MSDEQQLEPPVRVAITLGDVAGIGPEIVLKALASPEWPSAARALVLGDPDVLARTASSLGLAWSPIPTDLGGLPTALANGAYAAGATARPLMVRCGEPVADLPLARLDARAGRSAYDCLIGATDLALAGTVDAIVTAPLNKAALHAAGLDFPGHTEILADRCGVHDVAMMLYLPTTEAHGPAGFCVAHTTLHTSLRSVFELLTPQRIGATIGLVQHFLQSVGLAAPRIAVCALNPHGGEGGLFGDEEQQVILPAVEEARARGLNVAGPLPVDTLLRRALLGEFDGVVAMYHDQGHIALKLVAFERAVNVTLGLPIVRTSPTHGTAFDIAGQGIANAAGMLEAVRAAVRLAQGRRHPTINEGTRS